MPIYEYQCQSCQKIIEHIQKISDPLLTECPECHGKLEKQVSSTSFQLKGTGWYVTDFKNADKKSTENKKTAETTNADDKSDKKASTETSGATSTEKESTKTPSKETPSGEK